MISILFEDDAYLAVAKPEGLATIPERRRGAPSLLDQLQALFPDKLYVVHRLDKPVSGALVFARHAAAHRHLNDQFSARKVQKTYIALVHGSVADNRGVIEQPIRAFGSGRMGVDPQRGKASLTRYHVLERYGPYTLLEAQPATGRRHQLRVHWYSLGHPIVGDVRYGDKNRQRGFARLMLHAHTLRFTHLSGALVHLEAPLPQRFVTVMETLALPLPQALSIDRGLDL